MVLLACLPLVVGPQMLSGAAIASCAPGIFYAIRYKNDRAIWAFPYSYYWMICLSWISLYALLTPHKNGWMTRDLETTSDPWPSLPGKDPFTVAPTLRKAA
ncbi:MAG: hypothetical protein C0403_00725 [Desulfobacterium sp.]|nr:hypothetical protein [Desulfobacterium sp.]